MKKPYEEPRIVIRLFLGQDIITSSTGGTELGGDEDDDGSGGFGGWGGGSNDTAP